MEEQHPPREFIISELEIAELQSIIQNDVLAPIGGRIARVIARARIYTPPAPPQPKTDK